VQVRNPGASNDGPQPTVMLLKQLMHACICQVLSAKYSTYFLATGSYVTM
jgi:hypothetical protein